MNLVEKKKCGPTGTFKSTGICSLPEGYLNPEHLDLQ